MGHDLSELTWQEAEQVARQGAVVVIPTGAHEQHGPHLPLATDALLVTAVARRAAELAQTQVFCAPTLWLGFSPHHLDFPGTISLSTGTYLSVAAEICRSLWQHGFHRLVLLNGHGGNTAPLRTMLFDLRAREGIHAVVASYWELAIPFITSWRRSEIGGINHACEMETSLMLYLREDLVRQERVLRHVPAPRSAYLGRDLVAGGRAVAGSRVRDISASGVVGDPTVATADHGRELLEAIVTEVARFFEEVATWEVPSRS